MSSSESDRNRNIDYEKITSKKRNRDEKDKHRDKREKSYERRDKYEKKEKYEKKQTVEKSNKKREKSRSPRRSRSRSNSHRRDISPSISRKHKNKNDNKQKDERRKRKYDDEIEELKDREIKKKLDMENKKKLDEEKFLKDKKYQEEKNKPKEKVLTEKEKDELKKQTRLARARALALIESVEEKKSEILNNKNVLEDFLEKDKEEEKFEMFRSDNGTKLIDDIEKYEHELSLDEKNNKSEINLKISSEEKISISLSKSKFDSHDDTVFEVNCNINKVSKIPKLPKEFLPISLNLKKDQKQANFGKNITTASTKLKEEIPSEDEDPLDAYMKSIEKDATLQEYQVIQYLTNESLQKRYDEIAQDDGEIDVVMETEENIDHITSGQNGYSNQITLEDILNQKKESLTNFANGIQYIQSSETSNQDTRLENHPTNDEDDDEFHKKFVETLKKQQVPDYDPLYGYSYAEGKRDSIIYQEDFNEFLKEDSFVNGEETWQAIKRNAEKAKELKAVIHSQINYEPFRKDFYIETKEVSDMKEGDLIKFRKEHGDIKVRGKNIPKPIFNWYQCGLSDKVIAVLERKSYKEPFPIQCQAIPCIMSGRDIIGIAETGSGKTLAFVLPMLRHVMDQKRIGEGEGPIAFVMAPTRELATQIHSVIKPFAKILNINAACIYGGAGIGSQISELRRGAEIVVCTPGRMIEMLCMSNGKITNLQRVTYVVIDEADRLFDMGFEPQIARMLGNIRPDRQTVMFSATFPRKIENLAKKILNKPIEIVVGQRGQSCASVDQHVEILEENHKFIRLLQILTEYSDMYYESEAKYIGIIIFVDQKSEADELFKELFKRGYSTCLIHGGQDQEDRNFAIHDFKTGVKNILISTSVCARGLDVKHCGLVINFKCPNHMEDYVHRVGRTGRAGRKGVAYTFISKEEAHLAEDILRVLEISDQEISEELIELVRFYREKLESGEASKYRMSGYVGRGYVFSTKEKENVKKSRKELGKGYINESDEEEVEVKGALPSGDKDIDEEKNKTALALITPGGLVDKSKEDDRRRALLKDKRAKQIALDVGTNAVKNAILAGKTEEEALQIAQEAIERVLAEYKPSVSMEKGIEQAAKVIEEWVERENIKNNIFTCELDINDYPTFARSKVTKRDFLNSTNELTGSTVTVRGVFVEPGKKIPAGQKKLHLYIQGNTKGDVLRCYKEIKQLLDDSALTYYTTNNRDTTAKYHI